MPQSNSSTTAFVTSRCTEAETYLRLGKRGDALRLLETNKPLIESYDVHNQAREQFEQAYALLQAIGLRGGIEEALALYDEALPGKGTILHRLHEWRKAHKIPMNARDKLPTIIEMMLREIRRRTVAMIALPQAEGIDLSIEQDDEFDGTCWYEGNYRSRVEVNTNALVQSHAHINMLLDTLCHEVYPGHHTQYTLCEQQLYRERGYIEEAIGLIFSPRATIGECFATNACGMLFSPQEQEAWLAEHVYSVLGIEPDKADVEKIQRAADLLEGVRSNVVYMIHQRRGDEKIREYADKYMHHPDIAFLKEPFHEGFGIVEGYAKQLLGRHLQGTDRWQVFRRLITQQVYPSMLEKP